MMSREPVKNKARVRKPSKQKSTFSQSRRRKKGRTGATKKFKQQLQRLPRAERRALELSEIEKRSIREIARELGVSGEAVRVLLSQGRAKIKGRYHRCDENDRGTPTMGPFNLTALGRTALACLVTWGLGGLVILVLRLDFAVMPVVLVLGIVPWVLWLEREYRHIWQRDNGDREDETLD